MALIKITASELENVHSQISRMSEKASDCVSSVASVKNNLDMEVSAKRNIEEKLESIKRDLGKHSEMLKSYANVLNDVVNEFVSTDSNGKAIPVNWGPITVPGIISGIGIGAIGHTGGMYNWGLQQDLAKISNVASLFGVQSAKTTETSFFDKLWDKSKKAVNAVGDKVKETYGNVVQATKDCVSWVKEKYDEKGTFYTAVQYGKAVAKIAGGVGAVILATGATAATGGLAGSLTVASGLYGVNDIASGIKDIVDIKKDVDSGGAGDIEENNLLKDGTEFIAGGVGGAIGEVLGDAELGEEIGEKIGSVAYDTGRIATTIYNISTGWDKIQQAKDFNLQGIASEFDDAAKGGWDLATKVEFNSLSDIVKVDLSSPLTSNILKMGEGLKYQITMLGKELPNTVNAIQNFSLINTLANNVVGNPVEIIEGLFTNDIPQPSGIVGQIQNAVEVFTN